MIAHRGGPHCVAGAEPCGALGAISALTSAYGQTVNAYATRLRGFSGLSEVFVATTDTTVRGFLGTFSSLAKRYGIYLIGSGDLPPFVQSRSASDRRTFADPDLHPAPPSVYVATSAKAYNEVFMWGPRNVRRGGPDVLRNVVASNRKVPLTPIEIVLGLTAGPARGAAAVANLRPFSLPGTRARIGFATSLPAFVWGSPPAGVNPCTDTSLYYMRCLNRLGANLVIQDEANPGRLDRAGRERRRAVAAAGVDELDLPDRVRSERPLRLQRHPDDGRQPLGPRVRRTERDHPARVRGEAPRMPLHR